jgi:hypothetical protein
VDIKDIRLEKRKLESHIQTSVSIQAGEFIKKTEMGIDRISIYMINVTAIGDDKPKYVIGPVEVELERI